MALILLSAGCSEPRDEVSNAHENAHWLPDQHALAAVSTAPGASANVESCKECHGADLDGGISNVSCSTCHMGGPTHSHPETWDPVSRDHMPYAQANGTTSCANQYCHGTSLNGVANSGPSCSSCHLGGTSLIHPVDWTQVSINHAPYASLLGTTSCANAACHGSELNGVDGSGPSCSSCHMGGPTRAHPESWTNQYTSHGPFVAASDATACSNQACHGTDLAGVQNSGPACSVCHAWPLAPGAAVEITCGFCHGVPPTDAVSPNRAGVHAAHGALSGVTCSSCHSGAGGSTDNALHMNLTPDVIFDTSYNSKSGTASFDAATATCANISCHGGPRTQTLEQATAGVPAGSAPLSTAVLTPTWYGGKLNTTAEVNNLCLACHTYDPVQATEYNTYYSGRHFIHLHDQERGPFPKYQCNDCHDITTLLPVNHFTSLNTSTMEGPASATVVSALNYNSVTTGCDPGCHEPRVWIPAPAP
jgi:predicted CxxxxCH...CXXCH cytochrome family protein